jgi:hypothetical protein
MLPHAAVVEVRKWLGSESVQAHPFREPVRSTFSAKKLNSPSAGLRCKVFAMKTDFLLPTHGLKGVALPLAADQKTPSTASHTYTIRSIPGPRTQQFYIGLLPGRPGVERIGSVVCAQDHEIWTKTDPAVLRAYLQERLPQVDIGDLVTEKVSSLHFLSA